MLVTADLHLREESAEVVLGEVLPGLFDLARELDQNMVAILGDLWHLRHQVSVGLLNAVRDQFKRCGVKVLLLPGNHDQVDVHGRNALEVLGDLFNVEVFTEPTMNQWGAWMPYRKDPAEMVAYIQNMLEDLDREGWPRVLYLHGGIRGATMNSHIFDDVGIPLEVLEPWEVVVCGHYHRAQEIGKVRYVGSPWQTRADEAGQEKGVWLVPDRQPYKPDGMKFLPQTWGPRHHLIELTEGAALNLEDIRPQDIVRVKTAAGVDVAAVGAELAKAGIARHTVTPEVEAAQARLEVSPDAGMGAYARAYAELQHGDLALEGLLEVLAEIQAGGAP